MNITRVIFFFSFFKSKLPLKNKVSNKIKSNDYGNALTEKSFQMYVYKGVKYMYVYYIINIIYFIVIVFFIIEYAFIIMSNIRNIYFIIYY